MRYIIAVFCKFLAEWPWRYRSRSKVNMCSALSYASDHLHLVWKKSIQNWRSYRVDTECGMDRQTNGRMYVQMGGRSESNIPPPPPSTLLCYYFWWSPWLLSYYVHHLLITQNCSNTKYPNFVHPNSQNITFSCEILPANLSLFIFHYFEWY